MDHLASEASEACRDIWRGNVELNLFTNLKNGKKKVADAIDGEFIFALAGTQIDLIRTTDFLNYYFRQSKYKKKIFQKRATLGVKRAGLSPLLVLQIRLEKFAECEIEMKESAVALLR